MIPYIEIIDGQSLKKVGVIEPSECWFELSYYDVGEFQVYCSATARNLAALKKGRFVKIPNKRFLWYITAVKYTFTAGGSRMISATGYEAKWLLSKRIIQTPKELQGTITSAVYGLVGANLGNGATAERQIQGFTVDTNELLIDISGTQATRGNLLEFVNALLKSYNCGSQIVWDNGKLKYTILNGEVKTNRVRFSQSFDNLLSSEYLTDDAEEKTNAYVVSTVEEVDYIKEHDTGATGINRAEILVESNISTKYEDPDGTERETTPDSALYQGWLIEEGKQALTETGKVEQFSGLIDLANSLYEFDTDFFIGDIIKVQDEHFNFVSNTRVLKYTFSQARVYSEEAELGE